MHEPSFMQGLELGKFLTRLTHVEKRVGAVEKKIEDLTGKTKRFAILASLWTFALLANVSSDRAAEFAVELVASAWRR
jgi:hypothetical protein